MPVAQANLAWLREPWDHPIWDGWRRLVPLVNDRAARSLGFLEQIAGDPYLWHGRWGPGVMLNVSRWRSAADLDAFLADRIHSAVWAQRSRWFLRPQSAVWSVRWECEGALDLEDAVERVAVQQQQRKR